MGELWKPWAIGLAAQEAKLRKLIAKAKLEKHEKKILSAAEIAAGFRFRVLDEKPAPLGTTRAGGRADVSSSFDWPEGHSFLMQIDLADVAGIAIEPRLPKSGLLSFFVLHEEDEPIETGLVHYEPTPKRLVRTKPPKRPKVTYPQRRLEFAPALTLPVITSKAAEAIDLKGDERDRYADDVYRHFASPMYRLGGSESDYYARKNVGDERVLLHLASSDTMSFFWGDADDLHFYVDEAAWKRADFSDAHPLVTTG